MHKLGQHAPGKVVHRPTSTADSTWQLLSAGVACAGQDVATEVLSSGFHEAEEVEEPQSYVEIRVPQKQRAGVLHVEVARGSLLSHSKVIIKCTPLSKYL